MALSETVSKLRLLKRINHTKLDSEIADQIDSCVEDLQITAGVINPDERDPLILAAIKLYVLANLEDDADKAEKLMSRYSSLKSSLQMATGYGLPEADQ